MDEQTLPERLRELSTCFAMPDRADDVRAALTGAADELERLARPAPAPGTLAEALAAEADNSDHAGSTRELMGEAADTLVELARHARRLEREAHPEHLGAQPRQTYLAATIAGGGARFVAPPGHLFAAIALPDAEARRLTGGRDPMPGLGVELDALGRELAGDAGVAVPMPRPLRVGATFRHGDPPSPGAFVFCGPALAVWRVLNVERLPKPAGGEVVTEPRPTHALDLEPVDVHDVPIAARVAEVPLPVVTLEVVDGASSDAG